MEASVERGAAENHDPSDEEHGKSCNRHQRRDQQTLQCYLGVADKAGDKVFYLSHQVSNTKSTAGRPMPIYHQGRDYILYDSSQMNFD